MRALRLSIVLLAVAAAFPAAAKESGRFGSFELGAGTYYPDIDSEFTAPGQEPFRQMFGKSRGLAFRALFAKSLFTSYGTLEAGLQAGYFQDTARGFTNGDPGADRPGDKTSLKILPTSLVLTYRFDVLAERTKIPFAPYARVALDRYNWWITDGNGRTAKRGATNGWSATAGLALLLDFFDRGLARDLDRESGVNHTYLYVDATRSFIDDFGSDRSWDLSDRDFALSGGLLFIF